MAFPTDTRHPVSKAFQSGRGLRQARNAPEHCEESRLFGSTAPERDQPLAVCPTVIGSAFVPGRLKILSLRQLIPCHVFAFAMSGSIRN